MNNEITYELTQGLIKNYDLVLFVSPIIIGTAVIIFLLLLIVAVITIRKKSSTVVRTELKVSTKFPFKVDNLLIALGGKENISSVDGTFSKIKFGLNNAKIIKPEELKNFSTGIIRSSTGVTLIFGNISKPLADNINEILK